MRRERLAGLAPWDLLPEQGIDPRGCLEARAALAKMRYLGPAMRRALLDVASGKSFEEIGEELDKPVGAVILWLERGREVLAAFSEREEAI